MNKILITLLLILTIFQTKANIVSSVLDTASIKVKEATSFVDTSSAFKVMYSDVKAGVIGLAAGLKIGVEHVYVILIKQQIVKSITWLIIILIIILFSIIYYRICKYAMIKSDNEVIFVLIFFGFLVFLSLCTIVLYNLNSIITGFINPEYGAIKDVIGFIKN